MAKRCGFRPLSGKLITLITSKLVWFSTALVELRLSVLVEDKWLIIWFLTTIWKINHSIYFKFGIFTYSVSQQIGLVCHVGLISAIWWPRNDWNWYFLAIIWNKFGFFAMKSCMQFSWDNFQKSFTPNEFKFESWGSWGMQTYNQDWRVPITGLNICGSINFLCLLFSALWFDPWVETCILWCLALVKCWSNLHICFRKTSQSRRQYHGDCLRASVVAL